MKFILAYISHELQLASGTDASDSQNVSQLDMNVPKIALELVASGTSGLLSFKSSSYRTL